MNNCRGRYADPALVFWLVLLTSVPGQALGQDSPALHRTQVSVETYVVMGSSLPELKRAVVRRVESSSTLDDGAASATLSFRPSVSYEDGRTCRLATTAVYLDAVVRFPQWNTPANADEEARLGWSRFTQYLRWHEGRHVSIADDYRMRMELQLAALDPAPSCELLGVAVVETVEAVKQRHSEAQAAFDASERERSLALSFGR